MKAIPWSADRSSFQFSFPAFSLRKKTTRPKNIVCYATDCAKQQNGDKDDEREEEEEVWEGD